MLVITNENSCDPENGRAAVEIVIYTRGMQSTYTRLVR
jgi:hypothetical protein